MSLDWESEATDGCLLPLLKTVRGCKNSWVSQFYRHALDILIQWKTNDTKNRRASSSDTGYGYGRPQRDHDTEPEIIKFIATVVVEGPPDECKEVCAPLLKHISDAPEQAAEFFKRCIYQADRLEKAESLWVLWKALAEKVNDLLPDGRESESRRHGLTKVISSLFFNGVYWKEGFRHWHHMAGREDHLRILFHHVRHSPAAFKAYAILLKTVGSTLLPAAFVDMAEAIAGEAEPQAFFGSAAVVSCLESVLREYVIRRPPEMRTNAQLRASIILLLDRLVDAGSSTAFRLREYCL